MDERDLSEGDARNLRFLRILVLVLTATMIAGMAVLVVLFATRFPGGEREAGDRVGGDLGLPDRLELPADAVVQAVTRTRDRWIVVTASGDVFFFAEDGGAPERIVSAPQ